MRFRVVPPSRMLPALNDLPAFILRQDGWNDFSFRTLYQLYFADGESEPTLIGNLKILKRGQTDNDGLQLTEDFDALDEMYCSVGQSLDYYERLAELGQTLRDEALTGLRDFVRHPELASEFRTEKGWKTSLFRDFSDDDEFISLARSLLTRDYTQVPAEDLNFSFQMPGWQKPLEFNFSAPAVKGGSIWGGGEQILPSRIAVIVGRNGSGKSTLLFRLARVIHGSRKDRSLEPLISLGSIDPEGIGFPRILTISYSAFDSFEIPGIGRAEREQIVRDLEKGEGRFVFCGLRDIGSELKEELKNSEAGLNQEVVEDRVEKTLLKSIEQLAAEFSRTLDRVKAHDREKLFNDVINILTTESSFNDLREKTLDVLINQNPTEAFLAWSTGHKIVMQIISSLVAYTEPRALVLFDEPETHLHPPLLASLMHAIRLILKSTRAFAVVATHSPVVLQETMAQHVLIVRREGGLINVNAPVAQTFGENIGLTTAEVFGLHSDVTDYHKILAILAERYKTLEEIEPLFETAGLSMQGRAYLMSLLAEKGTG